MIRVIRVGINLIRLIKRGHLDTEADMHTGIMLCDDEGREKEEKA